MRPYNPGGSVSATPQQLRIDRNNIPRQLHGVLCRLWSHSRRPPIRQRVTSEKRDVRTVAVMLPMRPQLIMVSEFPPEPNPNAVILASLRVASNHVDVEISTQGASWMVAVPADHVRGALERPHRDMRSPHDDDAGLREAVISHEFSAVLTRCAIAPELVFRWIFNPDDV